ncbi:MAG TPA: HIT family protein [Candidatus Bathyarchaeia archaeon]
MCIFCRIIEGSAPGYVVYEDELTFAFLDINPISDGHTLIVTRAHVERVEDLPAQHSEALFRTLRRLLGPIQRAMGVPSTSIGVNNGREAGQLVPHVHVHVIPRSAAGKRVFTDAVARIKPRSPEYFSEIAAKIRGEVEATV